ncbi:MAG: hypothetical protein AAGB02_06155 [Pseudomonadota bacterium]
MRQRLAFFLAAWVGASPNISIASGPLDVAFRGFPEKRLYEVACSVSENYKIGFSFGAPEGIDMRGGGVLLDEFERSSSPVSQEMLDHVTAELENFASINSVAFQCGWRQTIPDKESGNYIRMEIAGLRNCLTEQEMEKLEEVGSIDRLPFVRQIEISPTTISVTGSDVFPCATNDPRTRDFVRPSKH